MFLLNLLIIFTALHLLDENLVIDEGNISWLEFLSVLVWRNKSLITPTN